MSRLVVVGLAGGVASGKSRVARLLAEMGAEVMDADRVAHDVLASPEVAAEVRRAWGEDALDAEGRPDRRKIAEIVFRDPARLKQLTGWVHPPVRRRIRAWLDRLRAEGRTRVAVIDAPLLIEGGLDGWCDVILFVEASDDARARRARERGWDAAEVARREAAQLPLSEKRARSGVVVRNDGALEETRAQLRDLVKLWTSSQTD